MRYRPYSHLRTDRYDRMGQGSLVDLAQRLARASKTRCQKQCSLRAQPVATEPTTVVLGPGTELSVIGAQPGWAHVVAVIPGSGTALAQTFTGWVAVADLDPTTPAGQLPPEPTAPPIPEPTPAPTVPTPPATTTPSPTLPVQGGDLGGADRAVQTLGEVIVLTSPAWLPMLLSRWARR